MKPKQFWKSCLPESESIPFKNQTGSLQENIYLFYLLFHASWLLPVPILLFFQENPTFLGAILLYLATGEYFLRVFALLLHLFQSQPKVTERNSNILFQIYCIYPKYSDISTPYHICSKIWTSTIHNPMLCLKIAGWVANSVDSDETLCSVASHLGLYCSLRPVCPNTYGKYGRSRLKPYILYNQIQPLTVSS